MEQFTAPVFLAAEKLAPKKVFPWSRKFVPVVGVEMELKDCSMSGAAIPIREL